MIDYFLAIKILLGTGGGTLNCSGNPASSGTVDDAYQDAPEEAKAADGAAVSETASNAYADASTDGLICEESFMCKADIFADTLPDTFKIDTEKEADIAAPPMAYCKDLDPQNDPYSAGAVVFLGPEGLVSLYDTCKTNGPNGMLMEVTCNGYHGKETTSSELETKYIKCNCEEGVCIEESAILCTDPSANVYYPGGSVWTNEDGKTHISVCNGESSVDWYYCNDDGTFHFDTKNCDDGVKCGDGMCGGYECKDSEPPGTDPDNLNNGDILLYNPTTLDWTVVSDDCHYGDYDESVEALKCPLHTSTDEQNYKNMLEDESSYDVIPCPEDTECSSGICKEIPEKKCEDTDPENDIHSFGTVIYSEGDAAAKTFPDSCQIYLKNIFSEDGKLEPMSTVIQYYCKDDGSQSLTGEYCPDGEVCKEGICQPASEGDKINIICEDYDDGIDPMNAGDVFLINSDTGEWVIFQSDSCKPNENNKVVETYCDDDKAYQMATPCPENYFCVEGSVVIEGDPLQAAMNTAWCETCVDTDENDDKAVQGNVTDISGSNVSDFCNADKKLKQAYCNPDDGTISWSSPEDCPEGTTCAEGACK